jgi:hypothetical protein
VSIVLLVLLFAALPLGPAALELGTGLALAGALVGGSWRTPTWQPVLALGGVLVLSALAHGGGEHVVAALRTPWSWALAIAVPLLARRGGARVAESVGLAAAAAVAAWGMVELGWLAFTGAALDDGGATGPFSHHLTLGYALLPPTAWALWRRRWFLVAVLAGGVAATLSTGPLLSLGVAILGVFFGPLAALLGGGAAVLGGVALLGTVDPQGALAARSVLWTASAELALSNPLGVGPAGYRDAAAIAQDTLQPGFFFPLHAHDSALQLAAVAGPGAWLAAVWLVATVWRLASTPGRAALAAILVGSLTQDTLHDLEVVRSVTAWALLPLGNSWRTRVSGGWVPPPASDATP